MKTKLDAIFHELYPRLDNVVSEDNIEGSLHDN